MSPGSQLVRGISVFISARTRVWKYSTVVIICYITGNCFQVPNSRNSTLTADPQSQISITSLLLSSLTLLPCTGGESKNSIFRNKWISFLNNYHFFQWFFSRPKDPCNHISTTPNTMYCQYHASLLPFGRNNVHFKIVFLGIASSQLRSESDIWSPPTWHTRRTIEGHFSHTCWGKFELKFLLRIPLPQRIHLQSFDSQSFIILIWFLFKVIYDVLNFSSFALLNRWYSQMTFYDLIFYKSTFHSHHNILNINKSPNK
jgi:hypothetical protein